MHDQAPAVDGAVVAEVRDVDGPELGEGHRAAGPPGRVEVRGGHGLDRGRERQHLRLGRHRRGRGGRVVVTAAGGRPWWWARRSWWSCSWCRAGVEVEVDLDVVVEVVVSSVLGRDATAEPAQPLTARGGEQHRAPTAGPSRRDLIRSSVAPHAYVERRMAAIERDWVALTSPTGARAGHGPHPCQGLYHRPAGARPDRGVHRHPLQRRLLGALPRRATGRRGASGSSGGTPATGATRRTSCSSTRSSTSAPACAGCARRPASTRS